MGYNHLNMSALISRSYVEDPITENNNILLKLTHKNSHISYLSDHNTCFDRKSLVTVFFYFYYRKIVQFCITLTGIEYAGVIPQGTVLL